MPRRMVIIKSRLLSIVHASFYMLSCFIPLNILKFLLTQKNSQLVLVKVILTVSLSSGLRNLKFQPQIIRKYCSTNRYEEIIRKL